MKTYKGKNIQTDWQGNKYVIIKGQFIKLNRKGEPSYFSQKVMKKYFKE